MYINEHGANVTPIFKLKSYLLAANEVAGRYCFQSCLLKGGGSPCDHYP